MSKAEGAAGKGAKGAPRTKTHMCIRRIPIAYTVGQLCPKIEVPAPKSKKAQSYVSKRLHVFICNTFKSEKLKYEQKFNAGGSVPKYWGLTKDKCTAAFGAPPQPLEALLPPISAAIVRNGLKKVAGFKHQVAKSQEGVWTWNEDEPMPDEQEMHDTVTPENICAYVGAPRGPLHGGCSTGVVADLFNTDVRSILMVLWLHFKGTPTSLPSSLHHQVRLHQQQPQKIRYLVQRSCGWEQHVV